MRIQVNSLPFFGRRKFTERLMLFFAITSLMTAVNNYIVGASFFSPSSSLRLRITHPARSRAEMQC